MADTAGEQPGPRSEVSVRLPDNGSELVILSRKRCDYVQLSNRSRVITCQIGPDVGIYAGPDILPANDTVFADEYCLMPVVLSTQDEQIQLVLFNKIQSTDNQSIIEEFFLYVRN